MTWLIGIALALIILIVMIMITKLHITLHYSHERGIDSLKITFRVWRFLTYTYDTPFISLDQESPSIVVKQEKKAPIGQSKKKRSKITIDDILARMRNTHKLLGKIEGTHKIIKRFLRRVKVTKFKWHTQFGLGDAALTGTASGAIWMLKGNIIGLIGHYTDLKTTPDLFIQPLFQVTHTQVQLSCMISFRIGYAMRAGFQIVKFWKGRQPTCQKNIQSRA